MQSFLELQRQALIVTLIPIWAPNSMAPGPVKGHVLGVKGRPLEREERLKKLMTSKAYGGTPAPRTIGELEILPSRSLTKIAPEKLPKPNRKGSSSNHHFQGRAVKLWGCIEIFTVCNLGDFLVYKHTRKHTHHFLIYHDQWGSFENYAFIWI